MTSRFEELRKKAKKLMRGKTEAQLKAELKREKARYEKEKRMESYRKQLAKYKPKRSDSGLGGFFSNAANVNLLGDSGAKKKGKKSKGEGYTSWY